MKFQRKAIELYAAKYPLIGNLKEAPADIVRAMRKIAWYKVAPTRMYFIDNAQGFGHRDEIPLTEVQP